MATKNPVSGKTALALSGHTMLRYKAPENPKTAASFTNMQPEFPQTGGMYRKSPAMLGWNKR